MTEEFLPRHPNPLQWLQLPSLLFLGFHPQVITGVTYVTVILIRLSLFLKWGNESAASQALLQVRFTQEKTQVEQRCQINTGCSVKFDFQINEGFCLI